MSRHAARRDANHATVVAGLRQLGYTVLDMAMIGGGVPDLLVWKLVNGITIRAWVEVKTPKSYSTKNNGLTNAEAIFFEFAPGAKIIAYSAQHAHEQLVRLTDLLT